MSGQTESVKKHALDSGSDESNSSDEWTGPKPTENNQVNAQDVEDTDAGPLPPAPKKRKSSFNIT